MYSNSYWNVLHPEKETPLMDLSVIKTIPIGFFIGADETTCLIPQSEKNRDALGDMCQAYKLYPGETHGSMLIKNSDEFYNDIFDFLTTTSPSETFLQ